MSLIQIPVGGDVAAVLPVLLVDYHLHRTRQSSIIPKSYAPANKDFSMPILTLQDGTGLSGGGVLTHLIATHAGFEAPATKWANRAIEFSSVDFAVLRSLLTDLDRHLTLRSFIHGYVPDADDFAIWGAIRGNKAARPILRKFTINVARWYDQIESSTPWLETCLEEFNRHSSDQRMAASSSGASYEIDLPNMSGPVVTRFPPEPSGYLHIGHAKAALLNEHFAHAQPDGKLICRFDDTNPSKESQEFQDSILFDLGLMDVVPDVVSYSSDYFQVMYELALELVQAGKAFADDSELGKGDHDRRNRLPSKRRDLSIEETLGHFAEMKEGTAEGQRWCLRARIAYDHPNGTLRDPVIYRCNLQPHHRTGKAWKIYPTYDFCAPILDSLEGVTLALRTNEYRDRNAQYEWMQQALGLRAVTIWDFSRMNFVRTVLSKRKLARIVAQGRVWGWDDPRMPTIRGIMRRGMTVTALRDFILKQGPSRNILNLEWGALWAVNRKVIDPVAPRYTAIDVQDVIRCSVSGLAAQCSAQRPLHPKNPAMGTRSLTYADVILIEQADAETFEVDEEITLMGWGNAFIRSIKKDEASSRVSAVDVELHLDGDFKKTKKKITWLASVPGEESVALDLYTFDFLVTKDKLEPGDDLEEYLTPVTQTVVRAMTDREIRTVQPGTTVQFERKGFFRFDGFDQDTGAMVFFDVPTGKA
ncbi:glutamyl-tRNA synthetase-like protein [Hortaea werneckii]|nr:glutamyl-tRNA synthetase-like protein [Hortaea werneckii]KAI6874997.1 glutamyl-tRNA synthetase-like protein [Hortaea werneckii]KAI7219004.1 glutamyl-tRNA synthetase-like protein [Hortaea werneckii]KAI7561259.1 glutamyl-tRNA synthetase-like protein [Hortaea werneckii]KAI7615278.1 glutamyl-tRNA synthetase-like protein [Hortaea werneckii]